MADFESFSICTNPFALPSSSMAVSAPHFTLRYFFLNVLQAAIRPNKNRDRFPFFSQMVEIQDQRVTLTTINTWVKFAVLPNNLPLLISHSFQICISTFGFFR